MKAYFRTICVVFVVLLYCSCQKEVATTTPTGNSPADSTATDSTITEIDSSLAILSFSPDSGRVGTLVTITGRGFDLSSSGNTVTINGTAAEVLSSTATGLVVQVKEGTTTGKISVTAYGKTVKSVTGFIVVSDSVVSETNAWKEKSDLPIDLPPGTDIVHVPGIAVGNKGYLFIGFDLWQYDPTTDHWTKKATRPGGTGGFYPALFSVNNKIYVGSNSHEMPDSVTLWEYTIATDTWAQKRNLPVTPRLAAFAFAVNNTGYFGGGQIGFGPDDINAHDFWKYNANADTWTRQADFPGPWTIGISGFTINNEGYVYDAGLGFPQAPTFNSGQGRLWHYDIANNTWTEKATCPGGAGAMSAVAFAIGNTGYVAVSRLDQQSSPTDNFWMYDPAADTWTKKADVGGGVRWFGTGFAIGSKGYIGLGNGGMAGAGKNDFWEYTPD